MSGNVFDPKALYELFPDKQSTWTEELKDATGSIATPVTDDEFHVLPNETSSFQVPNFLLPPQINNHGNYIISLSQLCRWLAQEAENLGVEIYPGFAASEVLLNETGDAVTGIATRDVGVGKDGEHKDTFERGVALHAKQTLFAEGARGSCSEWLMDQFSLRGDGVAPQTYGLGIKEVWQIPAEKHKAGLVKHTMGYPLQSSLMDKNFGGLFLYHQEPDLVLVGMVVGLDYENPYLNPYQEFQRSKLHPVIRQELEGGTCVSYGARVLNEGGYHSLPKTTFPGGALIGCSAGFLNALKIKGTHTALKSGMLAAESIVAALTTDQEEEDFDPSTYSFQEITSYPDAVKQSWVHEELYEARNFHAAFPKWGVGGGMMYAGFTAHVTKGREPWTLSHPVRDSETTCKASAFSPIQYPSPDGKLTFDLLTNLQRAGTYHAEDQPSHLRIKPGVPVEPSLETYAGPEQRFCPAGVYEYVDEKLVINAQNCVHCKCCSIKMPNEYIEWTVPEGGGGPQYQVM